MLIMLIYYFEEKYEKIIDLQINIFIIDFWHFYKINFKAKKIIVISNLYYLGYI